MIDYRIYDWNFRYEAKATARNVHHALQIARDLGVIGPIIEPCNPLPGQFHRAYLEGKNYDHQSARAAAHFAAMENPGHARSVGAHRTLQ